MDLTKLQNGSDIRGIAITTETETANLTPEAVELIGRGLVNWLVNEKQLSGDLKVAVGFDSRLSGPGLRDALVKGITQQGGHVIEVNLSTTPAMFMATQFPEFNCDAGVMITASHLPYYFNGIKIFSKSGGAEKNDIAYILNHTEALATSKEGTIESKEIISMYASDMVNKIKRGIGNDQRKPLAGFKIIVDAGNGAGGFFAEKVLAALGADTTGSQFLEPDGHFPNHMPNPDNKEAMASIQSAVLREKADLGVIFDTDVDRAAVVDGDGNVLNRNNLIAVLATIVLQEYPHTTIVTNSPTSSHLKDFIEDLGGKQVRYLCGYRNVINKMMDLNKEGVETHLAIETSGHAAFKENYDLDDGAYVIAKILMLLPKLKSEGKTLGELIAGLKQPAEAQEVRFKLELADYRPYGEEVIKKLPAYFSDNPYFSVDPENEEGIRFNVSGEFGSGWFLLRMSLHEPLLVLQVENDIAGNNQKVFAELLPYFQSYEAVDCSKLDAVLK